MAGINRIDSTPARLSTNLTVGKQTNATSFGERVSAGLQQAGSVVASGAALIGGAVPGAGAILSTAVSSLGHMSGGVGGAGTAAYAATGAINTVGSTTVNSAGGQLSSGGTGGPNLGAGMSNPGVAAGGTDAIAQMSQENMKMMNVQIAMQRENQMFSSVSNVLKTKHDTVKNSIGNIR